METTESSVTGVTNDNGSPTSLRPSGPRLGVLDFHLIQYHVPLYQRLACRGQVQLDVLYLRDAGYRPVLDVGGFDVPVAWDIDLLSGYENAFLGGGPGAARRLTRWLRSHEVVLIHGHSDPWMLFAAAACHALGIPYLLRGDAMVEGQATGIRRLARDALARAVVSAGAAGLAAGQRNREFYEKYRARGIVDAPYSVDNDRFAAKPVVGRADLLAQWGLASTAPVVMFCGKLKQRKRPLDLAEAVSQIDAEVTTLFVGDGALAGQVRAALPPGRGAVTGFVNQASLPSYYHAADILVLPSGYEPWGLVVNEAMAAGVLPVVSDRVGAAPDLVEGIGEIYPSGDVDALAGALCRALARLHDPRVRDQVLHRVAQYSINATADGVEQATLAAVERPTRRS